MNKQKNKIQKPNYKIVSTQLRVEELDDIRDLCELTGHKMAYVLRVLVRVGAERVSEVGEAKGREFVSELGAI